MEKLVLRRKKSPKTAERTSILMRVRMGDYTKIESLAEETGLPMIQLLSLLLEFAFENLEVED